MTDGANLKLCYNRGCATKFDSADNAEGSCVYHPGEPFFHDAYKGWSCCKKKCTDFTEFLNIKAYGDSRVVNHSCMYHHGTPVFHEGMKYWSCYNKKTSDFNAFLEQVGCVRGEHCWFKNKKIQGQLNCRLDWHQTGPWVVVSIFGKKYDPYTSFVKLSAVKLSVELSFPSENSIFSKTMELCGIVDFSGSSLSILPTKMEIKLKKAEVVSWGRLEYSKSMVSNGN